MEISEGVIRLGLRPRRITPSSISIILHKGRTIRKLIGGEGGGRSTKKRFAQGKIKRKKIHARQLTLKNFHAMA